MPTNVPPISWGSNGFTAPDEEDVLTGVQDDFDQAFATTLNRNLETPQGQIASSNAAMIGNVYAAFLYYASQIDPAFAEGRFQDAIARLYFLTRKPATPTVVTATCTGTAGTVIPPGSLAIADDGNIYASVGSIIIPGGGSIDGTFQCVTNGPIACPANTLDRIYQAVTGWDSVLNAADGTPGTNVESRYDFEYRRRQSVAANALSPFDAVRAEVLGVAGVLDCYVIDNPLSTSASVGGLTLPAHSIYICAKGGTDDDVAAAIWRKKPPGCDYYAGSVTKTVYDDSYLDPKPSYTIKFNRPSDNTIKYAVTVIDGPDTPPDADTQIKNAIVAFLPTTAKIGVTIYAASYYAPLIALGSWVRITAIKVGTSTANLDSLTENIDKYPVTDASQITVTHV